MKILLSLIFCFVLTNSYTQIKFESNSQRIPYYQEITKKIRSLKKNTDFQLRVWIGNGTQRVGTKKYWIQKRLDLFILSKNNNNWFCESYIIIDSKKGEWNVKKNRTKVHDCDSIWTYFQQNKILTLPDMDLITNQFRKIDKQGTVTTMAVLDGFGYSFEFITNANYRRINYHCPFSYYRNFPNIDELKCITNIINLIYRKIEKLDDPC